MGSEARFGVEVRNGRALTDCVLEVMFRLVLGVPVGMALGASAAAGAPRDAFPYLSAPVPER